MRMNLRGLTGKEKKEWRANRMEPGRREELMAKMMAHRITELTVKRLEAQRKVKTRETPAIICSLLLQTT